MEKESKYYSLIMNYHKELFNEFKRYCESRKINLDRSRKYKSLFPLKKTYKRRKYNNYLWNVHSFSDFIENDKRFTIKSRIEFYERIAKINYRYCLAFYKMNRINQYKVKTKLYFSNHVQYNLLALYMPNELSDEWRIIYEISRNIGTDEDIELIIKNNFDL